MKSTCFARRWLPAGKARKSMRISRIWVPSFTWSVEVQHRAEDLTSSVGFPFCWSTSGKNEKGRLCYACSFFLFFFKFSFLFTLFLSLSLILSLFSFILFFDFPSLSLSFFLFLFLFLFLSFFFSLSLFFLTQTPRLCCILLFIDSYWFAPKCAHVPPFAAPPGHQAGKSPAEWKRAAPMRPAHQIHEDLAPNKWTFGAVPLALAIVIGDH